MRGVLVVATALVGMTLWASPAAADDPAHDPTVYCAAYSRAAHSFVFTGVAQAPAGHSTPPIALTVTCTYTSSAGTYGSTTTAPGWVVTTAGSGLIGTGVVTVCESAVALYADGHQSTVAERCDAIGIPVEPPDGEAGEPAISCEHSRVAPINRWLLVGTAVARVKTVPVSSVTVTCWLDDAKGATSTVAGATPGPVGITAGIVRATVADLTQKCVHMRAVYLDNTVDVATSCAPF